MADHKRIAHDLGNLAYRLTLLAENLRSQIQDEARRDQADRPGSPGPGLTLALRTR